MTMTAAGAVDVTCPLLTGSRPGSRRLRPRPGGGRGRTPTVSEIRYGWTVGAYPTGDRVTAVGVRAREPQRRSCYAAPPPGFEPGPQGSKGLRAAATPGRKDTSRPGPDGEGRDAGTVSHVPVALGTFAAAQRAPVAPGCAPVASRTGPGTGSPACAGRMPHSSDFAVGWEDRAGWGHVQFPLRSPSLLRQAGSGATHRARRAARAGRRRRAHPPRPGDRPRTGGGRGAARHRPHRHLQPDPHPEPPPPAVGGP